jgi:hypothetical protein
MKTTLVVLFIFCAAAAFGQVGGSISSQVAVVTIPDHPGHADLHEMATEHQLVGGGPSTYTYGQGERPLWEFGSPLPEPTPLGDVARAYRKEKLAARKAEIVFEKQGS